MHQKRHHQVLTLKKNTTFNFIEEIIINYSNILIIDDINDSGKTLLKISKIFNEYLFKLKFAVLVNNNSSSFKVDYHGIEIDKKIDNSWIVFPWENINNE